MSARELNPAHFLRTTYFGVTETTTAPMVHQSLPNLDIDDIKTILMNEVFASNRALDQMASRET